MIRFHKNADEINIQSPDYASPTNIDHVSINERGSDGVERVYTKNVWGMYVFTLQWNYMPFLTDYLSLRNFFRNIVDGAGLTFYVKNPATGNDELVHFKNTVLSYTFTGPNCVSVSIDLERQS